MRTTTRSAVAATRRSGGSIGSASSEPEAALPALPPEQGSDDGSPSQRESRLVRLAHELVTSLDPSHTAQAVALELADLVDAALAATYLCGPATRLTLKGLAGGGTPAQLHRAPAVVVRALAQSSLVRAEVAELEELRQRVGPCDAAIAVPMVAQGQALGALLVACPTTQADPELLFAVADLAALSLLNARRFEQTFAEARRDALTGLPNHRAFHEHLDSLLRDALSRGSKVSLVLFDLDDFKRINDSRGHPAGDRALRAVSRIALRALRCGEEVFRVGGEEFAIVLEEGPEVGVLVAERLRTALVKHRRGRLLPTLSAGVAGFPDDAPTKDELVYKADVALYAAKCAGKNTSAAYGSRERSSTRRPVAPFGREEVRAFVVSELAEVAEAIGALGRETTCQSMLEASCRRLAALLGATACSISRLDGDVLVEVATFWPSPFGGGLNEGGWLLADYPLTREVMETGRPRAVSLSDESPDPSEAFWLREVKMRAVLMLELAVDDRPWGLVEVYDARPRRFGEVDASLARLVVGQAAALLAQFENGEILQQLYRETLSSLSNALEAKDAYTVRHTNEVVELAVEAAAWLGLSGGELRAVELGALLHDIGKIRIPESILNKPGPLDEEEWQVIRAHSEVGERILTPIASLTDVRPIVRSHHERWDGTGYPDRLAGSTIPIGARIVAVCDAYRAMIEPRPYRAARSPHEARDELRTNSGSQFDPGCVEALLAVLQEREREDTELRLYRPDHVTD